jgi:hypothetical protein
MNPKRRWYWLGVGALVLVLGVSFCLVSWNTNRRLSAAFTPEELQILEKGERFTLYSLAPEVTQELKSGPDFEGYRIMGQTQVTNVRTRADLLVALYGGIGKGEVEACFMPRHGIRAVRGNKTVDLVICFECEQIEIYSEHGPPGATINDSPRPVFDRVLRQARVPLSGR